VVTDLIREVRDAGRVRDESLMNRVKALIDEKSWTSNEVNMRILRELEEVKVSRDDFTDHQVMTDCLSPSGSPAQSQTRTTNVKRSPFQA
jgi:hypothetical protein